MRREHMQREQIVCDVCGQVMDEWPSREKAAAREVRHADKTRPWYRSLEIYFGARVCDDKTEDLVPEQGNDLCSKTCARVMFARWLEAIEKGDARERFGA